MIWQLQWGRNFIVAEIGTRREALVEAYKASMGPQLYRCGNSVLAERRCDFEVASMGPQLYRCGNEITLDKSIMRDLMLQWGRNFIVAEIGTRREALVEAYKASMGPQLYRCGNWSRGMRA